MWIELQRKVTINGVRRRPPYRIDYPRTAAMELVAQERAVVVDGPHENRHQAGYPAGEVPPETTDPKLDEAVKVEDQDGSDDEQGESNEDEEPDDSAPSMPLSVVDFSLIDGIGPSRVEEIEDYLDENDLETADELLETDLTDLPGIGPAKVEATKDLLRGDDTDGDD